MMDLIAHFKSARNVLSVPTDRVIFREGEPGREMYILLEGRVAISVAGEVVEIARAGALLGEMALVSSVPRSATVTTRGACRFVSIDAKQFDMMVRESPDFARHAMAVMAERLGRIT